MKTICSNCQAENDYEAKYCEACGQLLPVKEAEKTAAVVFGYKPKKKIHPIFLVIIVVCSWVAFFGIYTLQNSLVDALNPSVDALNRPVDAELAQMAENMNRGCPFQVDEITVLVNVRALPNKTIQYNYKLDDITKAEINLDTIKKYVFPSLLKNTKENPEAKSLRDKQVTIKYNYKDKNGEHVTEYVVTPDMYK
jgi:ribosomal protein L40E